MSPEEETASIEAIIAPFRRASGAPEYADESREAWRARRRITAKIYALGELGERCCIGLNYLDFNPLKSERDAEEPLRKLFEAMQKILGGAPND